MQVTKHIMNGQVVRPLDADNIAFVMDWTGNPERASLSTQTIELGLEGYQIFKAFTNQFGASEGIHYDIEVNNVGTLKYYIDPKDAVIREPDNGDRTVTVSIKPRFTNQEFTERAKGTTFSLLKFYGKITDADIIDIPYVIIKDNQAEQLITLGLTTYSVAKATGEQIQKTAELIDELVKANTPNPIVPNPAPSIEIDVKAYISLAVRTALNIAYTVLLFIALTNLVRQIIEIIFPKLRFFKAMKLKRLIEIGCDYLGYNLESSILDDESGLTILPVPLTPRNTSFWDSLIANQTQAFNKGYPTFRDSIRTVQDAIDYVTNTYNAEFFVSNNTVKIEQEETFEQLSTVVLPNTFNDQTAKGQDEIQYNTDEWWKRYTIAYRTDFSDSHTLDEIQGAGVEYSTEPIQVQNADLVRIDGLNQAEIPCSLGARKDDLNFLENSAKGVAKTADLFMGTALEALINNRKGALQISSQFFSNTKVLWTINGKQPANYKDLIGANAIYNKYHKVNEVKNKSYSIKENMTIPMDSAIFNELLSNNFVTLETGEVVKVLNVAYYPELTKAEITYRQRNDLGNNTKTVKIFEE